MQNLEKEVSFVHAFLYKPRATCCMRLSKESLSGRERPSF